MKRPILISISILFILILIFGGIALSYLKTNAYVEDTTITSNIFQIGNIFPSYEGFIIIENEVYIYNSGFLDIKDVSINIDAFFISNFDKDTRLLIGSGENNIEIIKSSSNDSYTISLNATQNIAILSVSDGVIEVKIDVLVPLPLISYELKFELFSDEEWDALFF